MDRYRVAEVLSVVMPAHNEAHYLVGSVGRVVSGLRDRSRSFELVVVENGSTDDSRAVADGLAVIHPEVRVVHLDRADYGLALRCGFETSTGDLVVNFDVDLVDLTFLDEALVLAERTQSAVVVGSKRSAGSDDGRRAGRKLITLVFSAILRRGFGLRVSDTHGLKLLRRIPLVPLVERCRFGGDIFDTELIIRAERAGLAVAEIPVSVADQRPPRTSIVRRIPRSLLGLVRLRLTLARER